MSFHEHVAAWSRPPVDDVGYISSADMLGWSDTYLMDTIKDMSHTRYTGWRNHNGLWREMLGLDLSGRNVLEYGCGVGMEAAELARAGNHVSIADISAANVHLATRVINLTGGITYAAFMVTEEWPFFNCREAVFDVVNCSGVLHHIRKARLTMERFHEVLKAGGQVRLMLYSDEGWRLFAGTEPPPEPVDQDPGFTKFVRAFDEVGDYATWYDADKIEHMYGDLFRLERFEYLTSNRQYCAAILTRKD